MPANAAVSQGQDSLNEGDQSRALKAMDQDWQATVVTVVRMDAHAALAKDPVLMQCLQEALRKFLIPGT